jgi:hypothetical protein
VESIVSDCKIRQQNTNASEKTKGKEPGPCRVALENNTGESWRQSGSNHWCRVSTFQPSLAFLPPPSSSPDYTLHDTDGQKVLLMKRWEIETEKWMPNGGTISLGWNPCGCGAIRFQDHGISFRLGSNTHVYSTVCRVHHASSDSSSNPKSTQFVPQAEAIQLLG